MCGFALFWAHRAQIETSFFSCSDIQQELTPWIKKNKKRTKISQAFFQGGRVK